MRFGAFSRALLFYKRNEWVVRLFQLPALILCTMKILCTVYIKSVLIFLNYQNQWKARSVVNQRNIVKKTNRFKMRTPNMFSTWLGLSPTHSGQISSVQQCAHQKLSEILIALKILSSQKRGGHRGVSIDSFRLRTPSLMFFLNT
jgi:hypothetical protein